MWVKVGVDPKKSTHVVEHLRASWKSAQGSSGV